MVAEMLACTEDCFHTMFIIHAPGVFIRTKMDYYVLSSLMKAFRNVLTIIDTKPKFQVLRTHPRFPSIISWLQNTAMPLLVQGTRNDNVVYRIS